MSLLSMILLSPPFIVLYCAIVLATIGVILIKRYPIGGKSKFVGLVSFKREKND